MLKNLFFTTFLAFSSSYSSLNEAPFKHSQNEEEQSQFEYYTDYIDLYFFDNLNIEFLSLSSNSVNFFKIKGSVSKDKLLSTGVFYNQFKYFTPQFYIPNYGVALSTNIVNVAVDYSISFENKRLNPQVDKYGFALVSDFFDDGNENYELIPNSWINFTWVDSSYSNIFEITTYIPYGNLSQPPTDFANNLKNNLRFFNQNYYDKFLLGLSADAYEQGFADGFNNGFTDGYVEGENKGLTDGYNNGYDKGFKDGVASDFNAYSWLTGIFSAMAGLLSIQLLPNVSIGGILILIMVLTLLPFLIGLLKGGK